MKHNCKRILTAILLLLIPALFAGCGEEQTPYQINDGENYSISVRFDANGGNFTTNTSVIVDSYNASELTKDAEGMVNIALLAPDDERRGNDAFTPVNSGYFLAGWYAERTGSGEDSAYTYGGKWDFEKDLLTVDPAQPHSAAEPVLTLYAAWVPLFEIRFYDLATGEYMESYTFNPENSGPIQVPALDEETGKVEMYRFPERSGYTFTGAYLDEKGAEQITSSTITHPGSVDMLTGTAVDGTMDVYLDWMEGEWYHIFTAEQFADNASVNGNYVLHADLDFADQIWPTSLMYGNFTGSIQGNGYTIRNVTLEQTNNSKTNAGLFGGLTETASLEDLTFENITFTIKAGTRVAGTSYGLLAGTVASGAAIKNVAVSSGMLQIHNNAYFGTDDYVIGLLCGMGQVNIDPSGIGCQVVGGDPATIYAVVNDGVVTLTEVIPE